MRWLAAKFPDVPILMYHHLVAHDLPDSRAYEVSVGAFRSQLDLLCKWGFEIMTLSALIQLMAQGTGAGRRIAVITFDDGYTSFLELAMPELKSRGIPATIFVAGAEIGGSNRWDTESGIPLRPIMTGDELRAVTEAGIEIGAHGWRHRNLRKCTREELHEEIHRPRSDLVQQIGVRPGTFAYPYGEFDRQHESMLRDAGYSGAVAIFSGERTLAANPFSMRRIYVHPGDTKWRFACKVTAPYLRYAAYRGVPRAPVQQS